MVGKACQYVDAQEQVKIVAIGWKPSIRFAAVEDSGKTLSIFAGLEKVLQAVSDNYNQWAEAKVGEATGNGNAKKGKDGGRA